MVVRTGKGRGGFWGRYVIRVVGQWTMSTSSRPCSVPFHHPINVSEQREIPLSRDNRS